MYKRTNNAITVDEAREIFVKDGRDVETIHPTFAALLEHTFRSACIAGHVWNNAWEYGWIRTGHRC